MGERVGRRSWPTWIDRSSGERPADDQQCATDTFSAGKIESIEAFCDLDDGQRCWMRTIK